MHAAREHLVAHLHADVLVIVAAHLGALMPPAHLLLLTSSIAQTPRRGRRVAASHGLRVLATATRDEHIALARRTLGRRVTARLAHVEPARRGLEHVVHALEQLAARLLASGNRVLARRADELVLEE